MLSLYTSIWDFPLYWSSSMRPSSLPSGKGLPLLFQSCTCLAYLVDGEFNAFCIVTPLQFHRHLPGIFWVFGPWLQSFPWSCGVSSKQSMTAWIGAHTKNAVCCIPIFKAFLFSMLLYCTMLCFLESQTKGFFFPHKPFVLRWDLTLNPRLDLNLT